jgi:Sigma-70, region 4
MWLPRWAGQNKAHHRTLRDAAMIQLVSLDDPGRVDGGLEYDTTLDDSTNPVATLERSDLCRLTAAAIDALPENERVILLLYYDGECCLREIGNRLELSESRICQILGQAVERLGATMLPVEAGENFAPDHRRVRGALRSPTRGAFRLNLPSGGKKLFCKAALVGRSFRRFDSNPGAIIRRQYI